MAKRRKVDSEHEGDDVQREFASPPCYLGELDSRFAEPLAATEDNLRTWRKHERTRLTAQRQSLTDEERAKRDERIRQHLDSVLNLDGTCLGFCWHLPGEPDLMPLVRQLTESGNTAALAVAARKNQPLEFWQWEESTEMVTGSVWNIPVPAHRISASPDVILVPLLGFDSAGHRLGNGGGYFDRTLASVDPRPLCVGFGYDEGRLETIYPQPWDVPMDLIVTERGIVVDSSRVTATGGP